MKFTIRFESLRVKINEQKFNCEIQVKNLKMNFLGQSVSIKLEKTLGVFQGVIKSVEASTITINNAFHNGIRIKEQNAEVKKKFGFILVNLINFLRLLIGYD